MPGNALRIRVLGDFEITVDDRTVSAGWRLRKAEALVKLLALRPRHEVHAEQLMDVLWPDLDVDAARNQLRKALHVARRALDSDPAATTRFVVRRDQSLALRDAWVDATAFEEAAGRARRERSIEAYEEALDSYGGELLPADRYEEWAVEGRRRYEAEAVDLAEELAGLLMAEGRLGEAEQRLALAMEIRPWDEDLVGAMMRTQALAGRVGRALATYRGLAATKREELGEEPMVELQQLAEEIRVGRADADGADGAAWGRIGDLRLASGHIDGAIGAYRRGIEFGGGGLERKLAEALVGAHRPEEALRTLDEIHGGDDSDEEVRVAAVRAHALAALGRGDEAMDALAAGLALVSGAGSEAAAAFHEAMAIVAHFRGEWRAGVEEGLARLAAADETVAVRVFDIHHCIGQYHLYGDALAPTVEAFARDTLDTAVASDAWRAEAFAWCLLGESLLLKGRLDEAAGCLRRSGEIHASFGVSSGALAWQRLGEAALHRGDHDAVATHLEAAAAIATVSPMASHLWSRIHATAALDALERRRPEAAHRAVSEAGRAAVRYGECPSCAAMLHPVAAETHALLGDVDAARFHAEGAERLAKSSRSSAWTAMWDWADGWVSHAMGDGHRAAARLRSASESFAAAGQPYWHGRALGQAALAFPGADRSTSDMEAALAALADVGAMGTHERFRREWGALA